MFDLYQIIIWFGGVIYKHYQKVLFAISVCRVNIVIFNIYKLWCSLTLQLFVKSWQKIKGFFSFLIIGVFKPTGIIISFKPKSDTFSSLVPKFNFCASD